MSYLGNTVQNQNYVPAIDYFNGNGTTVAFTLSRPVAAVSQVQVVVNNVAQNPGSAFTVLNSTITFTSAPSSGTGNIYVYYTSPNTQVAQPSQGTVGITQLSATGTPSSSTFLRGDNSWASAGFASGTAMMFVQTAAPTGWTKSTTHNDKALRIVSGAASTGGSVAFSTAFASQAVSGTVGNTTLDSSMIPSHQHRMFRQGVGGSAVGAGATNGYFGYLYNDYVQALEANNGWSGFTGGGGAHTHSFTGTAINLAVQYVDVIIATKD